MYLADTRTPSFPRLWDNSYHGRKGREESLSACPFALATTFSRSALKGVSLAKPAERKRKAEKL